MKLMYKLQEFAKYMNTNYIFPTVFVHTWKQVTGAMETHIHSVFTPAKQPEIVWPTEVPKFGAKMRKHFLLDKKVTFLNHCGKGAVPRIVHKEQIRLLEEFESNPEYFLKVTRDEGWTRNIEIIAKFVGADYRNLAFVENTTRGISNILQSFPFTKDDIILYNSRTHPAIKNQIQALLHKNPDIKSHELLLPLPCSWDDILHHYTATIEQNPCIKLAVIDYVCGSPTTMFPVERLTSLCHQHSIEVLIDGAHAPGLVPLNLEKLGADFFVGNLHKWLFTPRGCAIQYVSPKYHDCIKPCIASFNFSEPYPNAFMDQGTRNAIPYLCVGAAVGFFKWIGGHLALATYNRELIDAAASMLASSWNSSQAEYPDEEKAPFMRNIICPQMKAYTYDKNGCRRLRYDLYHRFHIWVGVFLYEDELWIRIVAQIYCEMADYEKLRDAILILKEEEANCTMQLESKKYFAEAVFSGP